MYLVFGWIWFSYGTSDPSVSLLDLALVLSNTRTHVDTHREKKAISDKKPSWLCYRLDYLSLQKTAVPEYLL